MSGSTFGRNAIRRAALTAVIATGIAIPAAWRQAGPKEDPDAFAPVEEYARKVEEFTKSTPDLNKKIEEGAKAHRRPGGRPKARTEIEQLRGVVVDLLGRVSDNGELARLGAKALDC